MVALDDTKDLTDAFSQGWPTLAAGQLEQDVRQDLDLKGTRYLELQALVDATLDSLQNLVEESNHATLWAAQG